MNHPLPLALLRHGPTLAALTRAVPDRFRLIDAEGSIDGRALRARVAALAARWVTAGVGPGTRLAVLAEGRAAVLGLLAGSLTGADVVTVDPRTSAPLVRTTITDVGADAVCTADPVPQDLPVPAHHIDLKGRLDARGDGPLPTRHGGQVLLRSTGTSGHPRTSGRAGYDTGALGPALTLIRRLRLWRTEPMVITPPLHHGYGLGFLTLALLTGTPVVLGQGIEPTLLLALMKRHGAGLLITVPPTLEGLSTLPEGRSATTLRAIVTGSGPLHPDLSELVMDTFGDILHNLYGTTEGGWCCLATPADLRAAPGTVGRAVAGTRVRIINGEVFVASPLATQSQTIFVPTGDLGHFDDHGRLLLDGRRGDLVIVGGVNVDLSAVEDLIRSLPGVGDAAVRASPDRAFGHTLHAEVVRTHDKPITNQEPVTGEGLRRRLAESLPAPAVPRSWTFVDAVEHTPFGSPRRPHHET